nr:immunoglobulin light chain junction region [Macaca mulatta]MOV80173.1 immunoglobulin light chain junction region [Macaca mulatta]MOV83013.1 immunoglobulin light chain junction region [Macaca mulatta]MOV86307.1 immunoglobulin light chain junction region [Macaca mulatta]MOW34768.1 immunoglobulin light chain junction region [Macaca mulatta]
CQQYNSDPPTF